MNTTGLFRQSLADVPKDIQLQTDWSFDVADKISDLLVQRGMTQKELARKMGKRESEVSRWVSGSHNFTLSTLAKISEVLDYNLIQVRT